MNIAKLIAAIIISLSSASLALADCLQDARKVALDRNNVVQLSSYLCRTGEGPDDIRFKVEFYRVSDIVASLLLAKSTTTSLSRIIGTANIIDNDVLRTYRELIRQFGTTDDAPGKPLPSSIRAPAGQVETSDRIARRNLRTLTGLISGPWWDESSYPAGAEIKALKSGIIPDNLKYYHSIFCENETDVKKAACGKYQPALRRMTFWRSIRNGDIDKYPAHVAAHNMLIRNRNERATDVTIPADLRLAMNLAGGHLPDDFIFLVGQKNAAMCNGLPAGLADWQFRYVMRRGTMDIVTIQNISRRLIEIGGLFGERGTDTRLRVASAPTSQNRGESLGPMSETLGSGQKLIIPAQINFPAPDPSDDFNDIFAFPQTASELNRRLGTGGFRGNVSAFGSPTANDYIFGPNIRIKGILANGVRIDLDRPSANVIKMTAASGDASCPYLLSWSDDEGWINHGKALHEGNGKSREYTETISMERFRSRFRLEEREPELAFVDKAELQIELKNGDRIALEPDEPVLAARDGGYIRLYWGQVAEFAFHLPAGVNKEDVATSHLVLTGYYERYSSLHASAQRNLPWTDAGIAPRCMPIGTKRPLSFVGTRPAPSVSPGLTKFRAQ